MRIVGLVVAAFMFGMVAGNACTSKKPEAVVAADGGVAEVTTSVQTTPVSSTSESVIKTDSSPSVQEVKSSETTSSGATSSSTTTSETTQK
jgi:hypothetical protein